jgi:hypothetical protein
MSFAGGTVAAFLSAETSARKRASRRVSLLHQTVAMVLKAVYEQDFLNCSYGYRRGRSAHDGLKAVRAHVMEMRGGWVLEADIEAFFDTVDHARTSADPEPTGARWGVVTSDREMAERGRDGERVRLSPGGGNATRRCDLAASGRASTCTRYSIGGSRTR